MLLKFRHISLCMHWTHQTMYLTSKGIHGFETDTEKNINLHFNQVYFRWRWCIGEGEGIQTLKKII